MFHQAVYKDSLKFFPVDDSWLLVEDNLDAFIPYSALSALSDDQVTVLTKTIKNRYFNETPDQNKVEDLVNIYTDAMFAYPSVEVSTNKITTMITKLKNSSLIFSSRFKFLHTIHVLFV